MVNVFHNHNGIVHNKANSKDHRQKRKHVDTEPAKVKHKEATNHRYRHHDHRDKRCTAFAEERKDDRNHENKRNKDGFHHFLDGRANVNRSIATIKQFHAFRDFTADVFDAFVEFVCNFDMVTARLRHECKRNGILAVTSKTGTRIFRFVMDVCDIRNADHSSIFSRPHRNVAKGLWIENSAKRTD